MSLGLLCEERELRGLVGFFFSLSLDSERVVQFHVHTISGLRVQVTFAWDCSRWNSLI